MINGPVGFWGRTKAPIQPETWTFFYWGKHQLPENGIGVFPNSKISKMENFY
jgi:hypothetical protein